MGPIEKLMMALEADDIDILAPDAEKQAFGDPNEKENSNDKTNKDESSDPENNNSSGDNKDNDPDIENSDENIDDGEDDNMEDSSMTDDSSDDIESNPEPEDADETRIKNNTKIRMKHLYDIVSSNLDKLVSLDHDIKNFDIKKYSIIESKFMELKNNLFRFITDDDYISKDCSSYTKYYITSKELYNVCVEMTDLFFQDYNKSKERESKNNKQNYKDKK